MNGNIDYPESGGDKYDQIVENPFVKTADENVSTFSVDADGASYANMRRYLMQKVCYRTKTLSAQKSS
jgi:Ca-activated chloride channel family protein